MDSITQAVFGATIQGAMLGRSQGRRALLYGAVLGTLPDLDVVISYADPISNMTHHRGFSHSIFVLTAVAIVLAWLIRRWRPSPHYSGLRLGLTVWLVLITHTLLDAFTSYGTQLLWPMMPTPVAWSSIFIIDPFFTVPLLVALCVALVSGLGQRVQRWSRGALTLSLLYLAWTVGAKLMVEARYERALQAQGIEAQAVFSGTAPLNSLLWRVMARDVDDHYYEGFISILDQGPPQFVKLALQSEWGERLQDAAELQRLRWFTGDWLRYDVIGDTVVASDLRMGMAGHHFFRFVVARQGTDGWRAVVPSVWPGERGGNRELGQLWQRIWRENPPLPLAAWDAKMGLAPAPQANPALP